MNLTRNSNPVDPQRLPGRRRAWRRVMAAFPLGLALLALPSSAQKEEPASRAEQWRADRLEKEQNLSPEEVSKTEARLNYLRDHRLLERVTQGIAGFRVRLGGLATGQGFAIGPEYLRQEIARGQVRFRGSARGAISGALLLDLQLTLPRLANDQAFLDVYAVHRNYPRIDYYGPGPDSQRSGRTNFRLETTSYDFTAGFTAVNHLKLGVTGGYLQTNVGPGNRRGIALTEEVFTPAALPALDDQSDFLRGGFTAHLDYRDNPGGPRSGGSYLARLIFYRDQTLDRHDFRRLELDAQQYVPFFNKRRVIALRVNTQMSFTRDGQTVPFYMQPILGGPDDLRGFRSYRFYGDNRLVATAEYRWETFSGLDAALFFDAGKVTSKRSQINFHDLEASVGFGLRFNIRNNVFMRIDVGFSHEGTQIWLKFKNPF